MNQRAVCVTSQHWPAATDTAKLSNFRVLMTVVCILCSTVFLTVWNYSTTTKTNKERKPTHTNDADCRIIRSTHGRYNERDEKKQKNNAADDQLLNQHQQLTMTDRAIHDSHVHTSVHILLAGPIVQKPHFITQLAAQKFSNVAFSKFNKSAKKHIRVTQQKSVYNICTYFVEHIYFTYLFMYIYDHVKCQ